MSLEVDGLLKNLWDRSTYDRSLPLQLRLFRMICLTGVFVSFVVVLPVNAIQDLPYQINLYVAGFGLLCLFCYWRSRRGTHHMYLLYAGMLCALAAVWFLNAGVDGSIAYYFFPVMVYPLALFRGGRRWLLAALVLCVAIGLILLEHHFPWMSVPFESREDRVVDLIAGFFSGGLSLAFIIGVVMENYDWEQRLQTRYARELSLSEKNYRDVVENALTIILRIDPQGRVIFVNRYAEELLGYDRSELIGRPVLGTLVAEVTSKGEDRASQLRDWLRKPESLARRESENVRKDGSLLRISWSYRPIYDEAHQLREILCVGVDITEKAGLLERLQMTQATVDAAAEQVIWADQKGQILYANAAACSALGYRLEELRSKHAYELILGVGPGDWIRHWERLRQEKSLTFEAIECRRDGRVLSVEVAASWMSVGGVDYVTSFIRDISGRKQAEAALRESEERFRQVVETISEVFWVMEVSGLKLIYASPSFERIWGASCQSIEEVSQVWKDSLHPNDRERMLRISRYPDGADGSEQVYRIIRKDGQLRWIRDRAFGFQDAKGHLTRIVGVAEDITERRELEERLLHRQRLEAVGTLSGGVAHDLNNILTPMLMAGSVLRDRLENPEDRELLSMIVTGARRGSGIINQLLTFCRGAAGERLPVHPRELVREMAHIMRETFPRNILICEEVPPDIWLIDADATQLHQVLMNLCVNARDAMPEGGTLLLSVENLDQSGLEVLLHPELKPGPYVVFKVGDTGHGIPPDIMERIFDPFFTTKEVGKGTGLGLSTVHGIVKSHGGYVVVDSQPGMGATFRVHLPALGRSPVMDDSGAGVATRDGRGQLILVVDDEASILASVRHALEGVGYRVRTAGSGEEALALLADDGLRPALILCDIMMPGMDGLEFARHLGRLALGSVLVGMSGMDQGGRHEELRVLGFRNLILKPFEAGRLIEELSFQLELYKHQKESSEV